MTPTIALATIAAQESVGATTESLQDLILRGGPLMIPIGVCSLVALAFAIERWIGLGSGRLGSRRLGRDIVEAAREGGATAALDVCEKNRKRPLARIVATGLDRTDADFSEREKVVEDAAHAEVRRMSRNLRPLFLVWLVAPLLGLLGTVWGMIEAFSNIAMEEGLGRPELLAAGIYRALTTTAAGLAVAIPAICAYWFLQGRIERFASRAEFVHREVESAIRPRAPRPVSPAAEPVVAARVGS
ncbi:MAG: MotA/TolQ/ExbB proton channel family protein [Planctomycetota bacterium]